MIRIYQDGFSTVVRLEETDTLKDMAAASGYTMEKLGEMISSIIKQSIEEEMEAENDRSM